ncbi:TPA: hypothetical protein ACIVQA_004149 [Salmonella enterica subsp. enterica serovar Lansing]|uniref:Uncharacterized protein n=2 Tax=Salmonella enterica TaxID=28901 RepID=A0A757YE55_SALER|nr:hypothetical protein [Salmonella enterica subsp. enterica serovar Braenderup]EAR7291424.1 hypothetical protein [Salmonella enterica]EBP3975103.1 hypothetical protein [Salmonella enterica subsp. enterica]EBY4089144.1 hypothetical protein [Salmonella enterica subsp. enterica serovar Cotham]EBZ4353908.1 hypothetical protein [Salmonella enterica subsp. enterica serovar Enteritidis]ECB4807067.1 hypothetical protein [Salmonella enterica subsp. enterica serovar Monschaui]ECD4607651.1 hypothetical
MNNILTLSKLKKERAGCCPHCGEIVFKTQPTGWSKSVQGKYIFSIGGDTIGGVWQKLTDEQKTPNAFYYDFNVGCCRFCFESFFAVGFYFINHNDESGYDIERTDIGSYLLLNEEMGEPDNYIISQSVYADIPSNWVMSVFKTPYGNMYKHTIGLIDSERLNEDGDILLRLFDSLKLIQAESNKD